jgi:hypothetical protein
MKEKESNGDVDRRDKMKKKKKKVKKEEKASEKVHKKVGNGKNDKRDEKNVTLNKVIVEEVIVKDVKIENKAKEELEVKKTSGKVKDAKNKKAEAEPIIQVTEKDKSPKAAKEAKDEPRDPVAVVEKDKDKKVDKANEDEKEGVKKKEEKKAKSKEEVVAEVAEKKAAARKRKSQRDSDRKSRLREKKLERKRMEEERAWHSRQEAEWKNMEVLFGTNAPEFYSLVDVNDEDDEVKAKESSSNEEGGSEDRSDSDKRKGKQRDIQADLEEDGDHDSHKRKLKRVVIAEDKKERVPPLHRLILEADVVALKQHLTVNSRLIPSAISTASASSSNALVRTRSLNSSALSVRSPRTRVPIVDVKNDRGATPLHMAVALPAAVGEIRNQVVDIVLNAVMEFGPNLIRAECKPRFWVSPKKKSKAPAAASTTKKGSARASDSDSDEEGAWAEKSRINFSLSQKQGETALHLAARCGNDYAVKAILDRLARRNGDSNGVNGAGESGSEAELEGEWEGFLDRGNEKGRTPLHLASLWGFASTCQLLAARGAAVDLPDANNDAPYDLAKRKGNRRVARVLKMEGAAIGYHYARPKQNEMRTYYTIPKCYQELLCILQMPIPDVFLHNRCIGGQWTVGQRVWMDRRAQTSGREQADLQGAQALPQDDPAEPEALQAAA